MLRRSRMFWIVLFSALVIVAGSHSDLMPKEVRDRLLSKSGRTLNEKEDLLKAFEARLLNMFGLKTRPRPKRGIQVPEYMMELYSQHNNDAEGSSLNPGTASIVRSHVYEETINQKYGQNTMLYMFNVSSVPENEHLRAAELRIYKHRCKGCQKQRIQVYDIVRPAKGRTEALLRLIDTRVINPHKSEWTSFDVLPAVIRWKSKPSSNHGLHIKVTAPDGNADLVQHNVRLRRSADNWTDQPLLITYSSDGANSRKSRGVRRVGRGRRGRSKTCRRHDMFVDFAEVGWNDWIVAPPGYYAFFCYGTCPYPLPDHLNVTNHAVIQQLVHSTNPSTIPQACCVPTELSAISMLYIDEYEKVVLKNYQDMVVEGCGCR